ncbi:hypothetical protein [Paenibacillus sp. cl141a]|uniref:hypothetical protein n=1 Tax=Paenibacillus sp. cl141a TaxID=1761877 RepID=UPI000B89AE2E|nr:hypothetical protein [Paenibacillus sp. cl141a]
MATTDILGMPEWQSIKNITAVQHQCLYTGISGARWMSRRAYVGKTAGEMLRLGTGKGRDRGRQT